MDSGMGDAREIRAARNQAIFRALNETMIARVDSSISPDDAFVIACECSDPTCVAAVAIAPSAYRSVRANPRRFALLPGHADLELENIVLETDRYAVAEKFGDAALVAEHLIDLRE